jgi:hypothetical protein
VGSVSAATAELCDICIFAKIGSSAEIKDVIGGAGGCAIEVGSSEAGPVSGMMGSSTMGPPPKPPADVRDAVSPARPEGKLATAGPRGRMGSSGETMDGLSITEGMRVLAANDGESVCWISPLESGMILSSRGSVGNTRSTPPRIAGVAAVLDLALPIGMASFGACTRDSCIGLGSMANGGGMTTLCADCCSNCACCSCCWAPRSCCC